MSYIDVRILEQKKILIHRLKSLKEHLEFTIKRMEQHVDNPTTRGFNDVGIIQHSATLIDNECGRIVGMMDAREIMVAEARLEEDQ